jgi:hypothetical protein
MHSYGAPVRCRTEEARLREQAQPDKAALHEALGAAYWYKGMEKEAAQE